MIEPALGFEAVAVDVEEVGRLLHFAKRLHAVLADLERHRGGDVIDALLDELGDPAQQADSFGRRRRAPTRKRLARGAHRLFDVLAVGLSERA